MTFLLFVQTSDSDEREANQEKSKLFRVQSFNVSDMFSFIFVVLLYKSNPEILNTY